MCWCRNTHWQSVATQDVVKGKLVRDSILIVLCSLYEFFAVGCIDRTGRSVDVIGPLVEQNRHVERECGAGKTILI